MHNGLVLFVGILFFLCMLRLLWIQVTVRRRGIRTVGVVVDVKAITHRDEAGVTFQPIVQFTTADGQQIRWKRSSSSSFRANTLGKSWPIIYDVRNPQRVIRDHWEGYAWIAALCFVSLMLFAMYIYG